MIPSLCPSCGAPTGIARDCNACGADLTALPGGPEYPGAALPRNPAQPPSVRYRSPRVVAMVASRWLWFAIVLGVAGVGVDALWLLSSPSASLDELISIAEMIDLVAVVQLVTLVVGGILFLAWFHRAYGNLRALGVGEPRYKRGWAIGAWFIPIVNLVLPKQMANDVWRAGDPSLQPNDPGWQGRPVAALLHWWWAFYLVAGAVSAVSGNMIGDAATLDAMDAGVTVDAAAQALWIAAAYAGTRVIALSTARQELRAGGLRAAGVLPAG